MKFILELEGRRNFTDNYDFMGLYFVRDIFNKAGVKKQKYQLYKNTYKTLRAQSLIALQF